MANYAGNIGIAWRVVGTGWKLGGEGEGGRRGELKNLRLSLIRIPYICWLCLFFCDVKFVFWL
ncbi:hypothetical protein P167DRAFT_537222 [Morchella conica CCBAS932]|uniref:Uncharacterized protein n=1 Tax=Morchella conica CCBAS932 TaxID=1392247 RepID=A0A3N4KK42_9PEZI|nr:hypothetical protein P167DRAFT_537222 [Morchella conica CCBAS932]